MREHVEKRLTELKAEQEKGERAIFTLRNTLLRIAGAIQVLEELLAREQAETSGGTVAVFDGVEVREDGTVGAKQEGADKSEEA